MNHDGPSTILCTENILYINCCVMREERCTSGYLGVGSNSCGGVCVLLRTSGMRVPSAARVPRIRAHHHPSFREVGRRAFKVEGHIKTRQFASAGRFLVRHSVEGSHCCSFRSSKNVSEVFGRGSVPGIGNERLPGAKPRIICPKCHGMLNARENYLYSQLFCLFVYIRKGF